MLKKILGPVLTIIFLGFLASCPLVLENNSTGSTSEVGNLIISPVQPNESRTISPPEELKALVDSYRVEFTGHATEPDFTVDPLIEGSSIEAVPIGDWTITLIGSDTEAQDIASGTPDSGNPYTVNTGSNTLTVTLQPISSSSGTLAWTITFPTEDVDGAVITMDPWPIGGADSITLTEGTDYSADFTTAGEVSINTTKPSGSYYVTVLFSKNVDGTPVDHQPLAEIVQLNDYLTSSTTTVLNSAVFTQPPAAPDSLSATAASSTEITLSWSDESVLESGFEIQRSINGGAYASLVTTEAGFEGYDDTITTGDEYSYRIRSENDYGYSEWLGPVLVPAAPTDFTADEGMGGIDLSWTDSSTQNTSYVIQRSITSGSNFTTLTTLGSDAVSYTDSTATESTTYYYRVRSLGGTTGESLSAEDSMLWERPAAPAIAGITSGTYDGERNFSITGSETIVYSLDGGSSWLPYGGGSITLDSEGTFNITARQNDPAGNTSDSAPTVTVTINLGGYLLWSYQTDDKILSSPALSPGGGTVYFGAEENGDAGIIALNATNGTKEWMVVTHTASATFPPLPYGPSVAADGTIYVGQFYGYSLYAINPSTQSISWTYNNGSRAIMSNPSIAANGDIYFGADQSCFYAIKDDGTFLWYALPDGRVQANPAIDSGGNLIFGSYNGKIYWFDDTTIVGSPSSPVSPTWSRPTSGAYGNVFGAAISGGVIYFGTTDGNLYEYTPDGVLKNTFTTGGPIASSPAIGEDGTVYIGSSDGSLYAIDTNGDEKWQYSTGGGISTTPAVGSDGTIYFGSKDYKVYAVNPDGSLRWFYTTGDEVNSSPVIGDDGTIYIGSDDGKLYAIASASEGLANSDWPMLQQNAQHTGREP